MIHTICCGGEGYSGGKAMAVVADRCQDIDVSVVDLNQARIDAWIEKELSKLPVYEPGLDPMVGCFRGRNLNFTTSVETLTAHADLVCLSVNTPNKSKCPRAGQTSALRWFDGFARQTDACTQAHTICRARYTPDPYRRQG